MSAISDTMSSHHRHCDDLFAAAEQAVLAGKWNDAQDAYASFAEELERHFATEERTLFPRFEAASGMTQGPTAVMRMEHVQMRALLEQMRAAVAARDGDGYTGAGETLLILMQQHNMKEENILYPMCDRVIGGGTDFPAELVRSLDAVAG